MIHFTDFVFNFQRRTLYKFGEVVSNVGNSIGRGANKINSVVEKVCEIVKTIIPVLSAVCQVGQFKFCSATEGAPGELTQALAPKAIDLNIQD